MKISWRYHALWIHGTCQGKVIKASLILVYPSPTSFQKVLGGSIGMEISRIFLVEK